jgi:hypothetical protein
MLHAFPLRTWFVLAFLICLAPRGGGASLSRVREYRCRRLSADWITCSTTQRRLLLHWRSLRRSLGREHDRVHNAVNAREEGEAKNL